MIRRPTRKSALANARLAGYHNDSSAFTRALLDAAGTMSKRAAEDAWDVGQRQREAGMRCECYRCKQ